jgi:hypothetical protein
MFEELGWSEIVTILSLGVLLLVAYELLLIGVIDLIFSGTTVDAPVSEDDIDD